MKATRRTQQRYDHRLRQLVQSTGNVDLARQYGVPASTARGWLQKSAVDVVTLDVLNQETVQLQNEVLQLRKRLTRLITLLRLIVTALKISEFSMDRMRIPEGKKKQRLLNAIDKSRIHFSLRAVLRVISLSNSRYKAWQNGDPCCLDDQTTCPRKIPQQLTPQEVSTIRDMVTSYEYRHVPTGTLARLAQRLGKVFVSATTWYRLVREHKWRRGRQPVYPAKPKTGIRATRATEIWHVDMTLIRLLDVSRAYLHAVIDNFSRRILAWQVRESFHPAVTAQLLLNASRNVDTQANVVVDRGVENFNKAVDQVVETKLLKRLLAQTDIRFSNSFIESWWRVLKHQWLYLNHLDSVTNVQKLVSFYVEQHNQYLPHSAFDAQTPDEMYFGTGAEIPKQLEEDRVAARTARRPFPSIRLRSINTLAD